MRRQSNLSYYRADVVSYSDYNPPLNSSGIPEPIQVMIDMTSRRAGDNKFALQVVNQTGGLPTVFYIKKGRVYGPTTDGNVVNNTWHHMDDFDPETLSYTVQLVMKLAHDKHKAKGMAHEGAVAEYKKYTGKSNYKKYHATARFFYPCYSIGYAGYSTR